MKIIDFSNNLTWWKWDEEGGVCLKAIVWSLCESAEEQIKALTDGKDLDEWGLRQSIPGLHEWKLEGEKGFGEQWANQFGQVAFSKKY